MAGKEGSQPIYSMKVEGTDITAMDVPTGVYRTSSVEYIPYHICSSKTTVHKICRCQQYPSHLLLPVIPARAA